MGFLVIGLLGVCEIRKFWEKNLLNFVICKWLSTRVLGNLEKLVRLVLKYIYIWCVIKALEGTDCSLLEGVVVVVVYESLHVIEDWAILGFEKAIWIVYKWCIKIPTWKLRPCANYSMIFVCICVETATAIDSASATRNSCIKFYFVSLDV